MTTARTHNRNVGRGGAARPRVASPKPTDFVPVSAEQFSGADLDTGSGTDLPDPVFDPAELDFDPADHNIDEVKAYVAAYPETAEAILELELNGKGRSGLLTFLDDLTSGDEG